MRDPTGRTVLFDAESRLGRRRLGRYIAVGAVVAIIIAMSAVYFLGLVVDCEGLYSPRSLALLVALVSLGPARGVVALLERTPGRKRLFPYLDEHERG